ncbi:MAG: DUF1598 domain-containing protein [Planctomycetota bacterium]
MQSFLFIASRVIVASLLFVWLGHPALGQGLGSIQGGNGNGAAGSGIGGGQTGGGITGGAGAGGGALADFESLMELIRTTIAPDAWEDLGGKSTMSPYAQGIFVDSRGIVRDLVIDDQIQGETLRSLSATLGVDQDDRDWRSANPLRVVSLRRYLNRLESFVASGQYDQQSLYLGGLSEVTHLRITADDILLAGPVGGMENRGGYFVDRETGRCPITIEDLRIALAAAGSGRPFGCTIDTTPEGLAAVGQVAARVAEKKFPIGKAADQVADALGLQRAMVFGIPGGTPLGYRLIEADRHMKRLALGLEEMPDGVPNYLDQIDKHIAAGVPTDLLLRLWFEPSPVRVRCDSARKTFAFSGSPIRLGVQNKLALAGGRRGKVTIDPRSEDFATAFNDNFVAIRQKYPIYGSVESLYTAAMIAAVLHEHAGIEREPGTDLGNLLTRLASPTPHPGVVLPPPRWVPSVAVLHQVRHARRQHRVLIASGGVLVDPSSFVTRQPERYPGLSDWSDPRKTQPTRDDRWWWNSATR